MLSGRMKENGNFHLSNGNIGVTMIVVVYFFRQTKVPAKQNPGWLIVPDYLVQHPGYIAALL